MFPEQKAQLPVRKFEKNKAIKDLRNSWSAKYLAKNWNIPLFGQFHIPNLIEQNSTFQPPSIFVKKCNLIFTNCGNPHLKCKCNAPRFCSHFQQVCFFPVIKIILQQLDSRTRADCQSNLSGSFKCGTICNVLHLEESY